MAKKINQAKPEGKTHPLIELNTRWKDSAGAKITIIKVEENRVMYIRDGYEHECVCSFDRLRREFSFLPEESELCQAEARERGRERAAELRCGLPISFGSTGWDKGRI
ncbi:DUF4222 domain-containing protein [Salmonella enterica subsp. enterica]|uniref:DUF4222 domain-containing protein n=1 Tax=Salmonella enterica TaxID=28901 RepID=UPI00076BAA7A|nr:DUF4222 domain-containing protein [Salmonella enterica]EAW1595202.1 DUF4222 domain-containing protein [Salmonella enterica subsp. enterica]EBW5403417.1 DUF4222 domain-containing protein [Salmonella enterica subsp. enterica serovar Southampton]EDR9147866.1 DUF4222 domain-containing protein [Salmonella enterica subsp. enterica serovar Agbeni]EEP8537285.1 DUF4222 domain-containing protein [Salmonella enterica subsp. enterica serovar Zega]EAW1604540.1 DUF4222 domain-containing protein [Salmonel